ncbi:M56 family metallopeptidase [Clostridium sp.]|uniref:M56 family metallopeptidase n=1 Tax=Clostridium sp. TaxID=1506 RepID=UPI002628B11A|nr:M56 family metallopeptidase [Clostridium sp.]
MELIERIFLGFFQSSLTASAIILIVILILKILNKRLSIRVKNAIWILVLIKLLIPVIPETNISLFNMLYEKYGSVVQEQNEATDLTKTTKESQVNEQKSSTITNKSDNYNENEMSLSSKLADNNNREIISVVFKFISYIWVTGLVFLSFVLLRFSLKLNRKTKDINEYIHPGILTLLNECKNKLKIKSRIPLYVHDEFKSPCIMGIVKPKIYIPKYVLSIEDNRKLSHVFLHELVHYKRKHLIYNYLGIIALLIHWFNPFVWIAIKQMRLYREYDCDAYVLELLKEDENTDYGMTLLTLSRMLLNKGSYSQVPVFFETNNQIKNRIWMIKAFKKGSYKMTGKTIIVFIIAASIILTNNIAVKALNPENIIKTPANSAEKLSAINPGEAQNTNGISSGETYKLINVGSGKALDVYSAETKDYANVDIYEDNGTGAQEWNIYQNSDGTYKLINTNSMKALDVYAAKTDDYTNVDIFSDNGTDAQKWNIIGESDGVYKLINIGSQKALDVYSAGTDNFSNVDIFSDNETNAQKWKLIRVEKN